MTLLTDLESRLDRTRTRRLLVAAMAGLVISALVAIGSLPTGTATVEGVVPGNARITARGTVGDARVLLLSQEGGLRLLVAYQGPKGWLGVALDPAPAGAVAAWAASEGAADIPALAAVYGRTDGREVLVRWADGRVDRIEAATDGTFLAARPGRVRSVVVAFLDDDGAVTNQVIGP